MEIRKNIAKLRAAIKNEPYPILLRTTCWTFLICFTAQIGMWQWLDWDIANAYDKIRPSLFTGFLTAGGFLLSLKTLILVQLRKEVFEDESYKALIEKRKLNDPAILRYAPLKNLGEFMLWAVFAAIFTSTCHLFMAFSSDLPQPFAITAFSLSATTLALVVRAWMGIRKSLHTWFETLKG